jgi:phosphoglycerate dehydrogenase-like enzyme
VKVLLPDDAPRVELEPVPAGVTLERLPAAGPLPSRIEDAGFLVVSAEIAPRLPELIPLLPTLEVLQTLYAGVEWLLPLAPPGATVCNASGVHDVPVAEWILAAILAMEKRLPEFLQRQREGLWDTEVNPVTAGGEPRLLDELAGKTVVVLGHGSIGRALEERLRPLGCDVVGVARRPRPGVRGQEDLPDVLPEADIVVLLLPLTEETARIVDGEFLARMRTSALLVNAARGPLVDTEALEHALRAGQVRAALDVTDPEPLPQDHSLWSAPNVVITPHVAGASHRWLARAYRFVGDQIRRWALGEPLANVRTLY